MIRGFLRAATAEKLLEDAGNSDVIVQDLTYLAGPRYASDARQGIEKALAANGNR